MSGWRISHVIRYTPPVRHRCQPTQAEINAISLPADSETRPHASTFHTLAAAHTDTSTTPGA
eukprot:378090-Prymnesium_polylepis.1